ncbi:MAG: hypothetical protein AB7T27_05435 [Kiritimatiellia bacterium]
MKKTKTFLLMLAALTAASAFPQPPNIPVAPLAARDYMGWTNAFRLSNNQVEAVIVPEIGRMIFFGPANGANLLRFDDYLAGKAFPKRKSDEWINFGGQWMWPAAQSVWPSFQTNDWPPSAMIDRKPWTGYAWTEADGTAACAITREYGEPLNVEARQIYRLMPSNNFVTIRQSLVRTGPSSIPVTLWNLVQVPLPSRVGFAAPAGTSDSPGWRTLMFNPPPPGSIRRCGDFVVYTPGTNDETKIGSRSRAACAAGFAGSRAVVVKSAPNGNGAPGEISTEIYVHAGLGYAELETLSAGKNLKEEEVLSLTVQVHLTENIPETSDPCDQVAGMEAGTP